MHPVAWIFAPALRCLSFCSVLMLLACNANTPQALISSAKQSLAKKDSASAVIQLKSALQSDPASREARLLLGEALLGAGDIDGAIIAMTKVLTDGGPEDDVLPTLSRAMMLAGDYEKLVTMYGGKSLRSLPAQAAFKTNIASAWGGLGDKAKTEAAMVEALAAVPDFGPAMVVKARLLAGAGRLDEATVLVDAAIAGNDRLHEAWLLKGEILDFAKSDIKGAEAAFRTAIGLSPSYVPAHAANISLRLRQRDITGAKVAADQLRAALPKHPYSALVDAQLAYIDRQFPRARELVQLLLSAFPDNRQALVLGGAVEAQLGSLVQAAAYFKKVLLLDPTLEVARRNLAEVEVRLGEFSKALETLKPMLVSTSPRAEALALAGDAEMRLGHPEAAERYFLRAAKLDPDNSRLSTAAAAARLSGGDVEVALTDLQLLSVRSKDTFADEALFAARMKRREFDAALAALDTMIQKQPGRAAYTEMLGRVHLARRDFAAARLAFEQALKVDPAMFSAVSSLASLDAFEGKSAQAIARLQASVDATPKNSAALMALADMKVRTGGPVDEIKKLYADAVVVSPTAPEPRLALIDLALRQRRFKDALQLAQDALAAAPWDLRVLDAAGQAQMRAGDFEQAATTFRKLASALPKSPQPYIRLAEMYSASGKHDKAESALYLALEISPDLVDAQRALFDVLVASAGQQKAIERIRRLTQSNPRRPLGYLLEAEYHSRKKDLDAAAAALRQGIAKTDSGDLAGKLYGVLLQAKRTGQAEQFASAWISKHPKDADFEYLMAIAGIARGDLRLAEQRLQRVLAAYPNHLLALNNLSWVMVNNGSKGAVAIARRALDLQPDNPEALNNLAWVLLNVGETGAVDYAQRAVELRPDSPNLMDTLAQALAADNLTAQAVTLQKRAIELAPKDNNLRLTLAKVALRAGDKDLARKELLRLQEVGAEFAGHAEVKRLMAAL